MVQSYRPGADPLFLGQRVVAILETGLRTATYKLATLMALIEHCIENMPEHPDDMLQVPIPELAHRVLETLLAAGPPVRRARVAPVHPAARANSDRYQ